MNVCQLTFESASCAGMESTNSWKSGFPTSDSQCERPVLIDSCENRKKEQRLKIKHRYICALRSTLYIYSVTYCIMPTWKEARRVLMVSGE